MEDLVYLVFLANVGRNSAIFAPFTHYEEDADDEIEIRVPSLLSLEKVSDWLDSFERGAMTISDWPSFYAWLGRKSAWGTFTQSAAKELVPSWLSDDVRFACKCQSANDLYFDIRGFGEKEITLEFAHKSASPDPGAGIKIRQLRSNMVLTCRDIFPNSSNAISSSD